jgi:hypothetical protein
VVSWGASVFNIIGTVVSFVAAAVVLNVIVTDAKGRQQFESRMLSVLVFLDACSALANGFSSIGLKISWQSAVLLSLVGQFLLFASFAWTLVIAYYLQNGEVAKEIIGLELSSYIACLFFFSASFPSAANVFLQ